MAEPSKFPDPYTPDSLESDSIIPGRHLQGITVTVVTTIEREIIREEVPGVTDYPSTWTEITSNHTFANALPISKL
ncbi:hypothetical protein AJ80_06735 [Polytolypa hystricis UAMH7299]|uniref:Uncharacterized protein n=1 Tax=Polytolypa hystricis (strain UAMH7299) TaxID=1447883 RepID=A0A2B7XTQ6_POLH7|nr:hypothetical protein AJ80_06735 [Polytolypa hystricis UAMH7299]